MSLLNPPPPFPQEEGDAYHRSGLYSHHLHSQPQPQSQPQQHMELAARGSSSSKPARNNSTCSASGSLGGGVGGVGGGRTRHSSSTSARGGATITRNNSSASTSSGHSTGATAPLGLAGAGGREVVPEEESAPAVGVVGVVEEDAGVADSSAEGEASLMEASTATASTVDSTAELVHRWAAPAGLWPYLVRFI